MRISDWRSDVCSSDLVIEDETGRVLHVPPPARELEQRLQSLCDFATQSDDGEHFVHPVVRALLIHFQIGYDHPFVDGNGRNARPLFYWSLVTSEIGRESGREGVGPTEKSSGGG